MDTGPQRWWTKLENNELRNVGAFAASVLLIAALVTFVLTRPDDATVANELPPPASTTSTVPPAVTDESAPSVRGGARPDLMFAPDAQREVGDGLAPWDEPPVVDFVRGGLLDITEEYDLDTARVAELLEQFPSPFVLSPLEGGTITTFDGELDAATIEESQPFAARSIQGPTGNVVGELWLIASGGSEAGDAYLAAADARWDRNAAIDQFTPDVGMRLWRLGTDERINLWASNLLDGAVVLIQARLDVAPVVLTDALSAWQRADRQNG